MSFWPSFVALFLGLTLAITEGTLYGGHSLGSPCLPGQPCTLAFISDNPVMLRCPHGYFSAHVSWQYLDPQWINRQPATFLHAGIAPLLSHGKLRRLRSKSRLVANNLYIPRPHVKDSGLYTCREGDATIAYYEVDFQDAGHLQVSHAGLGETTLENATAELEDGTLAELFTAWSPWQACDHCGHSGERKRVGFCYVRMTKKDGQEEKPLPCGMVRRKHPLLPQRGPELRVETCHVPCDAAHTLSLNDSSAVSSMLYSTYHLRPNTTAFLHCPASSIYSPVYWQEGDTSLTHLELLQKNSSHSLDKATGGGILRVSFQNGSHGALYQCYVNRHLVGKFWVASHGAMLSRMELPESYSLAVSLILGFAMFLVFLVFLSVIQSCRKKPAIAVV
ncbi:protein FAM187B-like [Anolis sagrei]|uniref:protein FAM187B-like n=1 Tax=Anolis sagrei TaxID=38937 RepID=UPI00351FCFD0